MSEYVLNGKVLAGENVTVDGITYSSVSYASIPGVIPKKPWPSIGEFQVIVPVDGYEKNGEWITFEVQEKSDSLLMQNLRSERNRRLAMTDWWATTDNTMTQAQKDYRQALRDFPSVADLRNPVWPEMP
jgi:hypothetical protein